MSWSPRITQSLGLTVASALLFTTPAMAAAASPTIRGDGTDQVLASSATRAPRTPAPAGRAKTGKLALRVQGLPRGVKTKLVVVGKGRKITTTAPTTLKNLKPGSYQVRAKNVHSSGATYLVTRPTRTARVKAGKTTTVTTTYGNAVSDDLRLVPPSTVTDLAEGGPGQTLVTLASGATVPRVGKVVVIGVGDQTPDGLLGKVTAREGSVITLDEATLYEALPQGAFSKTIDLTAAVLPRGSGLRSVPATTTEPRATGPSTGPAQRSLLKDVSQSVTCTNSASMTVKGQFSMEPSLTIAADWGLLSLKSAEIVASVQQSASLTASLDAAASCGVNRVPLLPTPLRLPPITVTVALVPLVFTPTIQLYFDASADVEGHIVASITQSFGLTAGLRYTSDDGLQPVAEVNKNLSFNPPEVTATAEIDASVTPELSLLLYGQAGPYVGLHGGLHLHADTTEQPWWNLKAYLKGYAGLVIKPLDYEKTKDPLVTKEYLLAEAQDDPPSTGNEVYRGWVFTEYETGPGSFAGTTSSYYTDRTWTVDTDRTSYDAVAMNTTFNRFQGPDEFMCQITEYFGYTTEPSHEQMFFNGETAVEDYTHGYPVGTALTKVDPSWTSGYSLFTGTGIKQYCGDTPDEVYSGPPPAGSVSLGYEGAIKRPVDGEPLPFTIARSYSFPERAGTRNVTVCMTRALTDADQDGLPDQVDLAPQASAAPKNLGSPSGVPGEPVEPIFGGPTGVRGVPTCPAGDFD